MALLLIPKNESFKRGIQLFPNGGPLLFKSDRILGIFILFCICFFLNFLVVFIRVIV